MREDPAAADTVAADEALQWWYDHLLAIALVDATVASMHRVAWLQPTAPDCLQLPDWPSVDLDRYAPGHAWLITATVQRDMLSAYLIPVRLRKQREGEFEFSRALVYDMMLTQKLTKALNPHISI